MAISYNTILLLMTIYTFVPHNIYYCTPQNVLSSTLKDTLKIVREHFRKSFVNRLNGRDKQQIMLNEEEEFLYHRETPLLKCYIV